MNWIRCRCRIRRTNGVMLAAILSGLGAVSARAQAPPRPPGRTAVVVAAKTTQPARAASAGAPRRPVPMCQRCHGELEFLRQHAGSLDRAGALHVSDDSLRGSGHDLPCTQCHTGFGSYPHLRGSIKTAACESCHPAVAAAWRAGSHAQVDRGNPVGCEDCHGIHAVATKAVLRTRAQVEIMNQRCLGCHDTRSVASHAPHADSIACASCHGAHDVRPHDRPGSTLSAEAQVQTCGACHARVAAAWRTDVHGRMLLERLPARPGEKPERPPTCTTCHGSHDMVHPRAVSAAEGPGGRCTKCHEKYADTFIDSYHGQATRLGSKRAAGCAGCHTAHAILPADSARSSVAHGNLVRTCAQCHRQATASFAAFQPHADVHDRTKSPLLYWTYKFMTLLLAGTMTVFGMHTALWLARLGIGRVLSARRGDGESGTPGGEA